MLPQKVFDKNGVIWCNVGVPKYVITNLKINNFKDNKSTTKLNCHISLLDQSRCACKYVDLHLELTRGVWGLASPPEAEEIFKKSNKMEAFPYLFVLFCRAP